MKKNNYRWLLLSLLIGALFWSALLFLIFGTGCTPSRPACTIEGVVRCEGTVLQYCSAENEWWDQYDCAKSYQFDGGIERLECCVEDTEVYCGRCK